MQYAMIQEKNAVKNDKIIIKTSISSDEGRTRFKQAIQDKQDNLNKQCQRSVHDTMIVDAQIIGSLFDMC